MSHTIRILSEAKVDEIIVQLIVTLMSFFCVLWLFVSCKHQGIDFLRTPLPHIILYQPWLQYSIAL